MCAFSRQISIALTCLLLAACGGGGSGDSSEGEPGTSTGSSSNTISSGQNNTQNQDEEVIAINGMGVKGPLANAIVSVYAIDNSKSNFRGRMLAEGFTDRNAQLFLDVPARHASEAMMLIEYAAGEELDGRTPVIPTLRTFISSRQFTERTPVYATPLTTLVLDSAIKNAGSGASSAVLNNAIATASTQTKRAFGLGLLKDNMDLFTHSPVLSNNTNQQESLDHRTAIEVFAAVMNQVRIEVDGQGGDITAEEVIPTIAEDMQDGQLDGKVAGIQIDKLSALNEAHLETILTTDPNSLAIPGTDTPISMLSNELVLETATINPTLQLDALTPAAPVAIEPDFAVVTDPEPEPEPTPEPEPDPTPEPTPDPIAPSVNFFAPAAGTELTAGSNLGVVVAANDSDGTITQCTLTLNGTALSVDNSAPYAWNAANEPSLANMSAGTYTLVATCTDNSNLSATASMTVTVVTPPAPEPSPEPEPEPTPEPDPVPPSVSFFSPANNTSYTVGDDIGVVVSASDSDGSISRCSLTLNGASVRNETSAPYSWGASAGGKDSELMNMSAGTYTIGVTCVDDDSLSSSAQVSVTVTALAPPPEPDPVPPTVSFSTPSNNSTITVGDTLNVTVSASDSDGSIASCTLTLNGSTVRTDSSAPYTWGANDSALQTLSAGTHTLAATCTDSDSLTDSASITLTIAAAPEPDPEPTPEPTPDPVEYTISLTWTAPATREDGSTFNLSDIEQYEVYYYLQGTSAGEGQVATFSPSEGTTDNPATITLTASGTYILAVSCIDKDGLVSNISDEVSITIP